MDLNHIIDFKDHDGHDGEFGRGMDESIENTPAKFKMKLEPKLPNAAKRLERATVGIKFHSKCLSL